MTMGSRNTSVRSVAYHEKASQYQKYITLSAVFLIITSTILVFTAAILMKFYHMTKLGFWSITFEMVPYYMIVLGIFTFISGLYGAFVAPLGGKRHKAALIVYAILMVIAFLAQLGSIFTALEVRSNVENNKGDSGMQKEFKLYTTDSGIKANWDDLQRDLHCCGGDGYGDGYQDWIGNLGTGNENDVPDSCCQTQSEGCGRNVGSGSTDSIRSRIFVDGCMEIIKDKLEDDVVPMMVVYACIGVVLAIVELISCVLSCAYVAQLNRRTSRTDAGLWRYADANAHTYPDETDRAPSALAGERSSLHDTVV
jgi:uncharacterized membrane protein YiaA